MMMVGIRQRSHLIKEKKKRLRMVCLAVAVFLTGVMQAFWCGVKMHVRFYFAYKKQFLCLSVKDKNREWFFDCIAPSFS